MNINGILTEPNNKVKPYQIKPLVVAFNHSILVIWKIRSVFIIT